MISSLHVSSGHPEDEELISALVRADDEVRGGGSVSTGEDREEMTRDYHLAGVEACLHLLEQAFPRSAPSTALMSGSIGRFELIRVLGRGGFGIVYLAYDPQLKRQVALKMPRLYVLENFALHQRFLREARAGAALDHPNIVPVLETGRQGEAEYIVSTYCEGPNLAEWLRDHRCVSPRFAAQLVSVLAAAMEASHRAGVLHRDLKPSNVLLTPRTSRSDDPDELPFVPRVTDFGLAKLKDETLADTGTAVLGTLLYMAPEQALSQTEQIGPATDVYSLGVILFELLTGHAPIETRTLLELLDRFRDGKPRSPIKLRAGLPRDLNTICCKSLEPESRARYSSAAALQADLQAFLHNRAIAARPIGPAERAVKWVRRHPWRAGTLLILMLALIVIARCHC